MDPRGRCLVLPKLAKKRSQSWAEAGAQAGAVNPAPRLPDLTPARRRQSPAALGFQGTPGNWPMETAPGPEQRPRGCGHLGSRRCELVRWRDRPGNRPVVDPANRRLGLARGSKRLKDAVAALSVLRLPRANSGALAALRPAPCRQETVRRQPGLWVRGRLRERQPP